MSADFLDNSQEVENRLLELRINAITSTTKNLQPKGVCHWCGENTSHPKQIFCDGDCADDHEMYHRK